MKVYFVSGSSNRLIIEKVENSLAAARNEGNECTEEANMNICDSHTTVQ